MPAPQKSRTNRSNKAAGSKSNKSKDKKSSQKSTTAKPATKPTTTTATETTTPSIDHQQQILNVFHHALSPTLSSPSFPTHLQAVKAHLYHREFEAAFGQPEHRAAYAARWSPSRALGYAGVFGEVLGKGDGDGEGLLGEEGKEGKTLVVTCLGGGAGAEIVGLAGWVRGVLDGDQEEEGKGDAETEVDEEKKKDDHPNPPLRLEIRAIDIADWSPIISALESSIRTSPTPSTTSYTTTRRHTNASALLPPTAVDLAITFHQHDLLSLPHTSIGALLATTNLLTLFFTLNELYTASRPRTHALLLQLTAAAAPGTLLLVVDSPGSYATVALGGGAGAEEEKKKKKRYPMVWLLEHALLAPLEGKPAWERLRSEASRWFRLPPPGRLRYPIELENMRYQVHLYRRC